MLLPARGDKRCAVPAGFKLVWLRLFLPLAGLVGEGGEVKGSNRSLGTRKSSSSKKDWILLAAALAREWKWRTKSHPGVFYLRVSFQESLKFTAGTFASVCPNHC